MTSRARHLLVEEARARGDLFYFTGIPCPHGHLGARYVSCHRCVACSDGATEKSKRATDERRKKRPLSARQQAQHEGVLHYNTGKPCPRQHYADRIVSNGCCVECVRENQKKRFDENQEAKDSQSIYRQNNRERYRSHVRNRRAKLKTNGEHSHKDIDFLWDQQRGRCAYCKCRLDNGYHVDHVIAVSKGGSNGRKNLQLTCQTCNVRKHNKDPVVYAQQNGLLL